jgi:hypothetical protein
MFGTLKATGHAASCTGDHETRLLYKLSSVRNGTFDVLIYCKPTERLDLASSWKVRVAG